MKAIEKILSADITQAFGWALVHSVWQGLAIALLVMILLAAWKPRSVHFKYMLCVAGLCAMFACTGFTFAHACLELETVADNALRSDHLSLQVLLPEPTALRNNETERSLGLSTKIWSMLQSNIGLVALAWLLGAIGFSFRLFAGLFYAKKMLRQGTQVAPNEWVQKLQDMAERLHIGKSIRLMASVLAGSPMVIGHFKPVILFPIGMMIGMSMGQIEAVLAHELAHIKRNDWLVNLMQSLAEALFFFHPAVWWLSSKIREEREKCCDDIAVQITGDAFAYVKTLSAIQAAHKSPPLTLAFAKKKYLLERVKRLISSDQEEKAFSAKPMLLFIVILCVTAFAFIFKHDKTKAEGHRTLQSRIVEPGMAIDAQSTMKGLSHRQDTLPKNKNQKNETENSKEKEEKGIASGRHDSAWEDEETINKFVYVFDIPEVLPLPEMDSLLHSLQTDSLLPDFDGLPFTYEFHSFNNGDMAFEPFPPVFPDIPDFDFQFPLQDGDTLILDSLSSAWRGSSFRAIKEELLEARRLSHEARKKYQEQMQEYQEQIREHQQALQELQGAYQQEMHKYREEFREKLEDRREHLHELREGKLEEMRAEQTARQRHLQALQEGKREKTRAEHKARRMRFEAFHEDLRRALIEDELIKEGGGIDFSYNAEKDEIKVNGKKLNKKQREKYKELLESHDSLPETGEFRYQNKL